MIIFGTRGVTSSAEKGAFNCPRCQGRRNYDRKRVRRFFTLYFIPVIPLDQLGEYIECQVCGGTFEEAVLSYNPEQQERAFKLAFDRAFRRSLVLMMLADGEAGEEERQAVSQMISATLGRELSEGELAGEIDKASNGPRSIAETLRPLAAQLSDAGKEMLIKGALVVAAADGALQDAEKALLESMAEALQMSAAHVHGILMQATAPQH